MNDCLDKSDSQSELHKPNSLTALFLQSSVFLEQLARSPEGADLSTGMDKAIQAIVMALKKGIPFLVAGNGGSASDSMHIAGELVGRFHKNRKAYPVISLAADSAVLTCIGNDFGYEKVFERQVEAYGKPGGVFLGITTSGGSPNILKAFVKARDLGMTTIALTGEKGFKTLKNQCDIFLGVPTSSTPRIQEIHVCLYHYLCEQVEALLKSAEPG